MKIPYIVDIKRSRLADVLGSASNDDVEYIKQRLKEML